MPPFFVSGIMTYLYIALGGALGAMSRYGVSSIAARMFGHGFPFGTIAVNLLGSFAMGVLIGVMAKWLKDQSLWHPFLAVGFLGAFTTFSTFALDVVSLQQRAELLPLMGYILLSVVGSVLALMAGIAIVRLF